MIWDANVLGNPQLYHVVFIGVSESVFTLAVSSLSSKEVRTAQWCLGEHSSSNRFLEAEHLGHSVIHNGAIVFFRAMPAMSFWFLYGKKNAHALQSESCPFGFLLMFIVSFQSPQQPEVAFPCRWGVFFPAPPLFNLCDLHCFGRKLGETVAIWWGDWVPTIHLFWKRGFPGMGVPSSEWWKILLKWMIWGYSNFRKPPNI